MQHEMWGQFLIWTKKKHIFLENYTLYGLILTFAVFKWYTNLLTLNYTLQYQSSNYHFALHKLQRSCKSYEKCKAVFSQRKFDSSTLDLSTLYPSYIYILRIHCILFLIRNIVYIQNCITKCKKCFWILMKTLRLQQAEILVVLSIFIVKWI